MTTNNWFQATNAGKNVYRTIDIEDMTKTGDSVKVSRAAHYDVYVKLIVIGNATDDIEIRVMTSDDGEIGKDYASVASATDELSLDLKTYWVAALNAKLWVQIRNAADNDDSRLISGTIIVKWYHD
jgi:hypothetical protein